MHPTLEGYLFLAVVLDVFSRKIVGWSIHDSLEAKIVLDALEMARASRRPGAGLLHHSDRGSQYASNAFQAALEQLGAISSMSRKGNCWDNAMMERPKPEGAGVGSRKVFSLRSKTNWISRDQ
jgi:putative transposase